MRWSRHSPSLRCVITVGLKDEQVSDWTRLVGDGSPFLSHEYLKVLESECAEGDKFWRCVVYQQERVVGIAVFHLTDFEASRPASHLSNPTVNKLIQRSLGRHRTQVKVLICGNAYATGEHGFRFLNEVSPTVAMDALCYALTHILRNEAKAGVSIDAVLAKDFYSRSGRYVKALRSCGFREFSVDPSMILPVDTTWNNFDDYLDALNSKFRTKANAAIKRSAGLTVRELSSKDILTYQNDIFNLYSEVLDRAEFRLGRLTSDALIGLIRSFGKRASTRGYFTDERLVGFSLAVDCGQGMDAHLVGFSYAENPVHGIYPRMLYEFIELSILGKKEWVSFGRTAGEIKSSVGAFPVETICCVRHPGTLSNLLMGLFFAFVQPVPFPIRQPWKVGNTSKLRQLLSQSGLIPKR